MKITVLANQLLTKEISTGGDVLSLEVLSRVPGHKYVYCPRLSARSIRSKLSKSNVISTDGSLITPGTNIIGGLLIFFLYIYRLAITITLVKKVDDADYIYLTGDFFCNTFVIPIAKIFNKNILVVSNFYHLNPWPWERRSNSFSFSLFSCILQRFSLALLKKYSDITFVLSDSGKQTLKQLGFDKNKIFVSGGGVDLEMIRKTKISKSFNFDALFLGRLNATKGIFDTLEITKLIKDKKPDFKIAVAGKSSPEVLKKIKSIIKKYKLNKNIKLLGFISDQEKYTLMKSISILVFPSHEEGFGIVILEALASGMRVISYDLPIYKEVFSNYKGRSEVNRGDTKKFANKILIELDHTKKQNPKTDHINSWTTIARARSKIILKSLNEKNNE